jgi:hypothetical protein
MLTHFVIKSATDFIQSRAPRGLAGREDGATEDRRLAAAISWLLHSVDVCGGRGSSKGYRFLKGWMAPYPETSGYIIPTLLALAHESNRPGEYNRRAEQIAGWLMQIQLSNGGFCGREAGVLADPDVFDTGMILLGFNSLLYERRSKLIIDAAEKAADFLVSSLDETGCFVRYLSHGILHTYNVRAAWGLVAYGMLRGMTRFVEAGMANARWTCQQQNASGYYANNAFKRGGNANTHGIAYVMQGLLQIHDLTADRACLDSAILAASPLQEVYQKRGWIAAELGPDWQYFSGHICLTGYAQLAIVFFRLFQKTGKASYRETAESLLYEVAKTQDLRAENAPHYGAIAGSLPIYGRYAPLQYPNWATKFFIDAMIAKKQVERGDGVYPLQMYGG